MEQTELISELSRWPAEKLPPCGLYKKLLEFTGLRNSWTCGRWIIYLKNRFK